MAHLRDAYLAWKWKTSPSRMIWRSYSTPLIAILRPFRPYLQNWSIQGPQHARYISMVTYPAQSLPGRGCKYYIISKYCCDALPAMPPFGTGPLRLIHRSLSTWMWLRRVLGGAGIVQERYKPATRTHDRTSNPSTMCKVAIRRVHNNIHHCYRVN